jgi:hypothetical protein
MRGRKEQGGGVMSKYLSEVCQLGPREREKREESWTG